MYLIPTEFDWAQADFNDLTRLIPHPGETIAETSARMKKIARSFNKSHGHHFIVEADEAYVLIKCT